MMRHNGHSVVPLLALFLVSWGCIVVGNDTTDAFEEHKAACQHDEACRRLYDSDPNLKIELSAHSYRRKDWVDGVSEPRDPIDRFFSSEYKPRWESMAARLQAKAAARPHFDVTKETQGIESVFQDIAKSVGGPHPHRSRNPATMSTKKLKGHKLVPAYKAARPVHKAFKAQGKASPHKRGKSAKLSNSKDGHLSTEARDQVWHGLTDDETETDPVNQERGEALHQVNADDVHGREVQLVDDTATGGDPALGHLARQLSQMTAGVEADEKDEEVGEIGDYVGDDGENKPKLHHQTNAKFMTGMETGQSIAPTKSETNAVSDIQQQVEAAAAEASAEEDLEDQFGPSSHAVKNTHKKMP